MAFAIPTPAAKIPASLIRRYASLMAFNERTASVSAREHNRKSWETLRREMEAEGLAMMDIVHALTTGLAPRAEEEDLKPRDPGCSCQWEEGDSPCPAHPGDA